MADQDTSQERTEEPTAKRLEKAREDGQVARSQELSVAAMMIGIACFMYLFGGYILVELSEVFVSGFVFDRKAIFSDNLLPATFGVQALASMIVILPIFALAIVIALGAAGALGGYIFSIKALAPKASKINPLAGFKRMFGMKALVDLTKALTKFSLVGGVLFLVVSQNFDSFIQLGFMDVGSAMSEAGKIIAGGTVLVTLTLLIAAAIDVPYQIFEFNKKMKMTKQEVKDESKETDGRPEVKARVRQLQREASQRRMLQDVPEADVVITNPTHYSVALKYDAEGTSAPIVVAKGADLIALKIRSIATENDVPIYSEPPLARAIFGSTEIGDEIPAPLFLAVARVLAYVFQLARASATDYIPRPDAVPLPDGFDQFNNEGSLDGL